MDIKLEQATYDFVSRVKKKYSVVDAILFGSQVRAEANKESDADVAILLVKQNQSRDDIVIDMAGIAFDVLMDTGVLIDPLPIWQNEWQNPEGFNNPALIENIRQQGIVL